jgi:hypothetical protein
LIESTGQKSVEIAQRVHKRIIQNVDNITAALKEAGFPIVHVQEMNDLTLAEQASWFASHDIILAVHGGALVNALFIRPKTTVITLYLPCYYYVPGVFESLIAKAGGVAMEWHQQGDSLENPDKLHRSFKTKATEIKYLNPPVQEIVSLVKKAAGSSSSADGR